MAMVMEEVVSLKVEDSYWRWRTSTEGGEGEDLFLLVVCLADSSFDCCQVALVVEVVDEVDVDIEVGKDKDSFRPLPPL